MQVDTSRPAGPSPAASGRARFISWLAAMELATRPVHPETRAALQRRGANFPDGVKTKAQALGQHAVGCEGTHGVFPRCNLACTPSYHSRDANQVALDGGHPRREVDSQVGLRRLRGPRAHAHLIGGEVTPLPPDDHAAAALDPYRHRFVAMFDRLQEEHGVRHVLACSMNVALHRMLPLTPVDRGRRRDLVPSGRHV